MCRKPSRKPAGRGADSLLFNFKPSLALVHRASYRRFRKGFGSGIHFFMSAAVADQGEAQREEASEHIGQGDGATAHLLQARGSKWEANGGSCREEDSKLP